MFRAYTESGETIRNQMAASETTSLYCIRSDFMSSLQMTWDFGVPTMFIPSAMFTIKSLVTDRFDNNMF
jgi:hypothetical protein